ncbi:MAG: hypothetical protein VR69_05735 [Peptococcaceae bacterium BRH_c4b]|nr:MAG: hypothetical protein VR69_05735 [Peptococcaceae bacterium BRH_c4b]
MARSANIACSYFNVVKQEKKNENISDRLVGAVNENYATLSEWNSATIDRHTGVSLLERFKNNYSTLMQW